MLRVRLIFRAMKIKETRKIASIESILNLMHKYMLRRMRARKQKLNKLIVFAPPTSLSTITTKK